MAVKRKKMNLYILLAAGCAAVVVIWGFVGGCGTSKLQVKEKIRTNGDVVPADESPELAVGGQSISYVVESGDTLWKISRKFNVTVTEIKESNNLSSDIISVGQKIVIPVKTMSVSEEKAVDTVIIEEEEESVVQKEEPEEERFEEGYFEIEEKKEGIKREEESYKLKEKTGSEESAEQKKNKDGYLIHKARSGESLWRIAQIYGVSSESIAKLNKLPKDVNLKAGQEILIPKGK